MHSKPYVVYIYKDSLEHQEWLLGIKMFNSKFESPPFTICNTSIRLCIGLEPMSVLLLINCDRMLSWFECIHQIS